MNTKQVLNYPSDFASRDEKESDSWGIKYAKALWSSAVRSESSYNFSSRTNDFIRLRKYASGKQDTSIYKSKMFEGNQSYINMDFSIQSPLPKLVEIMTDMIVNTPYKPNVRALDTMSTNSVDIKKKKMLAKVLIKQENEKLKREFNLKEGPIKMDTSDAPDDTEGFKVWAMMNSKAASALAAEELIRKAFSENEFENTQRKIARDLVVLGTGASRCYVDAAGNVKIRYVDPVNLVTSWVDNDNYSDSKHFGEVIQLTMAQLRENSKGQLDQKAIYDIAKSVAGPGNKNPQWEFGSKSYYDMNSVDLKKLDSFKVRVLDFECIQADNVKYVEKELPDGRIFMDRVSEDYEPGKNSRSKKTVHEGGVISYYSGKWVIGTDHIYDWGRSKNMIRRRSSGMYEEEPFSTFCVLTPDMYDMDNTSKVELAIPSIDQIAMHQIKIQHMVIEAAPPGLIINADAVLEGMSMLNLGDNKKPSEIRNIRKQLGDIYWGGRDESGQQLAKPVEYLPNGLDSSVERLQGLLLFEERNLKKNLGIPDGVDGTQPEERTSATVQKITAAGASAAMRNLLKSFHYIVEGIAERSALHYVDFIDAGWKIDEIEQCLGKGLIEQVKLEDLTLGEYKINVEMLPEGTELQEFMMSVRNSIQAGLLAPEDELVLKRVAGENIDKATEYMIYKRSEFDKKKQQSELQKIKAQSQGNAEAAERTAAAQIKLKIAEIQAKAKADIETTLAKIKGDLDLEFENRITMAIGKEYDHEAIKLASELKRGEAREQREAEGSKDEEPDQLKEMMDRAKKSVGMNKGKGYDLEKDSMPQEAGRVEPSVMPSTPNS